MNHPATTPLWPCPPAAPCQHQMAVLGRARQPSQIAWPHATAMMPTDTTRLEGQSQRHEVPSRIGTSDIFRLAFHVSFLMCAFKKKSHGTQAGLPNSRGGQRWDHRCLQCVSVCQILVGLPFCPTCRQSCNLTQTIKGPDQGASTDKLVIGPGQCSASRSKCCVLH